MAQVKDDYEAAPIRTSTRTVPPEWIDYNGHMNVAYYTMAFDQAADEILEGYLGVGETLAKSIARTIGSSLGRQILRGILGSITGRR